MTARVVHLYRHESTCFSPNGKRSKRTMFYACVNICGERYRVHIGSKVAQDLWTKGVKVFSDDDHRKHCKVRCP